MNLKGVIMSVNKECLFCKIVRHDTNAYILHEDKEVLAFLDLYPATSGHVLVIPRQHIEDIYSMSEESGSRIMAVAIRISKTIGTILRPDGINLIQANKFAAGQTISHFHLHIVPRYKGDPVQLQFGHGKIPAIAEELEELTSLIKSNLLTNGKQP
jgi:histidine triad (HIT) family protein